MKVILLFLLRAMAFIFVLNEKRERVKTIFGFPFKLTVSVKLPYFPIAKRQKIRDSEISEQVF